MYVTQQPKQGKIETWKHIIQTLYFVNFEFDHKAFQCIFDI